MTEVKIGECAVVTSFVGEEGEDMTDAKVNAKIVKNGKKGIWADPLGPGMHALNTKAFCKVDIVPTTQNPAELGLTMSRARTSSIPILKTITLRTSDAFQHVDMDVSVIIHIAMADAPKVVANLGSVTNMISQVLEPAISSHFRNAAQSVQALDLYTKRAELKRRRKVHLQDVHQGSPHRIERHDDRRRGAPARAHEDGDRSPNRRARAQDVRDAKTSTRRRRAKFSRTRRRKPTCKSESSSRSEASRSRRTWLMLRSKLQKAKRKPPSSRPTELQKPRSSMPTQMRKKSEKPASHAPTSFSRKAKRTAKAYKLSVDAMGPVFGQLKIVEQIASNHIKLIPDVLISGGGGQGGGGNLENLLGLSLIDKLTGKRHTNAHQRKRQARRVNPNP